MDHTALEETICLQNTLGQILKAGPNSPVKPEWVESHTLQRLLNQLRGDCKDQPVTSDLGRLRLCLFALLVAQWHKGASHMPASLPDALSSSFELIGGEFLQLSQPSPKDSMEDLTSPYTADLLRQNHKEALLLFAPRKHLKEKRLYKVHWADLQRLAESSQWQKLPDPAMCVCWIRLPQDFFSPRNSCRQQPNPALRRLSWVLPSPLDIVGTPRHAADGSPKRKSSMATPLRSSFSRKYFTLEGQQSQDAPQVSPFCVLGDRNPGLSVQIPERTDAKSPCSQVATKRTLTQASTLESLSSPWGHHSHFQLADPSKSPRAATPVNTGCPRRPPKPSEVGI